MDRVYADPTTMPKSVRHFLIFLGFGRSGHSFLGQCINAHRDCMIANEGRLELVAKQHMDRDILFSYLLDLDFAFGKRGYRKLYMPGHRVSGNAQNLRIEGAYQGETTEPLVLGNSKAARTVKLCNDEPAFFDQMLAEINLPVKVILQTRHPAAMITSRAKRLGRPIRKIAKTMSVRCRAVEKAHRTLAAKYDVFQTSHEDLLADPASVMRDVITYLELEQDQAHIDAVCAATHKPSVRDPMDSIEDISARKAIDGIIDRHEFFAEYRR